MLINPNFVLLQLSQCKVVWVSISFSPHYFATNCYILHKLYLSCGFDNLSYISRRFLVIHAVQSQRHPTHPIPRVPSTHPCTLHQMVMELISLPHGHHSKHPLLTVPQLHPHLHPRMMPHGRPHQIQLHTPLLAPGLLQHQLRKGKALTLVHPPMNPCLPLSLPQN